MEVRAESLESIHRLRFINEARSRIADARVVASLELVVEEKPDLLILHEGPRISRQQRGNPFVSTTLQAQSDGLVVCGHVHWEEPLGRLPNGRQVLNVDSRVVIVTASTQR